MTQNGYITGLGPLVLSANNTVSIAANSLAMSALTDIFVNASGGKYVATHVDLAP